MNERRITERINGAEKCMYTIPLPIATLLILTLHPCYKYKKCKLYLTLPWLNLIPTKLHDNYSLLANINISIVFFFQ